MLTAAKLGVEFTTQGTARVKRDLQDVGSAVSQTDKQSSGFLKGAFSTMTGFLGAGLIETGARKVVDLGKAFVWGASDTAEAQSKVNTVFAQSAGVIDAWAATSANSFGMTKVQALDSAGTLGNLFTSMGVGRDQAAGLATQFLGLAADMGSFNNVPTPQALAAIESGLVGEYEPLRKFGVLLTADTVAAKALEMGLGDANGELTEQEKVLARNALIMEQTTTQQGDFARTSTGLANQTRILSANLSNMAATIGAAVLPKVVKLTQMGVKAVQWAADMGTKFGILSKTFGPLKAGLILLENQLTKAFGAEVAGKVRAFVEGIITGFQRFLGVVQTVAGVVRNVLGTALDFIFDNFDVIGPVVAGAVAGFLAFSAVMGTVASVAGVVAPILAAIAAQGGLVAAAIGLITSPVLLVIAAFAALFLAYQKNFLGFADGVNAAVDFILPKIQALWDRIQGFADYLQNTFSNGFGDGLIALVQDIGAALGSIDVGEIVVNIAGWVRGRIADLWSAVYAWATDGGTKPLSLSGILVNIGEWARGTISDLWSTVKGWVLGTTGGDPGLGGDGTGGARPGQQITLGGILVNITDWAKGTIADIAAKVQEWVKALPPASVDLGQWILKVGTPIVVLGGWNVAEKISEKLTDVVVSLTEWTAQLDGAKVVFGTLDLAKEIGDKIVENPIKSLILVAGLLTLALFGAPAIVFGLVWGPLR